MWFRNGLYTFLFFKNRLWLEIWTIVCLKLIIYLAGTWMETFFVIMKVIKWFLSGSLLWNMHRWTVRIVDVYIFYSLNLGACFCFSFSNLVELFSAKRSFFGEGLASVLTTKYSRVVSLTFLRFVRNLNASVLDSIVSSEHLYINKLRHVHLFTDFGDILFTDFSNLGTYWVQEWGRLMSKWWHLRFKKYKYV